MREQHWYLPNSLTWLKNKYQIWSESELRSVGWDDESLVPPYAYKVRTVERKTAAEYLHKQHKQHKQHMLALADNVKNAEVELQKAKGLLAKIVTAYDMATSPGHSTALVGTAGLEAEIETARYL